VTVIGIIYRELFASLKIPARWSVGGRE
jgi:hypothetical protein